MNAQIRPIRILVDAARHPRIAIVGAREFRLGCGLTYEDYTKSNAYDAGRELAHVATFRRFEQW